MRITSALSHGAQALLEGLLVALLVVGLMAGTAFAGKPSAGGGTTGAFRVDDGVFAGRTTAHQGGSGTWVHATCYQDGGLVFEQYAQYGADHTASLLLGPTPNWSGGAASCRAEEGSWRRGTQWRASATTTFNVAG
jgi:hypothetical protein